MEKIISKILGIDIAEIISIVYECGSHDLYIETEYDYGSSYPVIRGNLNEPSYSVTIKNVEFPKKVHLTDLFTYISKNLIS